MIIRDEETGGPSAEGFAIHEMHHRVSNHLQILASVVGLQARDHGNPEVRDALFDVRRRILAIARLNSQLQRGPGGGVIEISHFMRQVAEDLRLCFSADQQVDTRLVFDVEPGEATMETAISLALIVNELVSNAVKYAVLPHGGGIEVGLKREADGEWRLRVRDEGPGMPPGALDAEGEHGFSLVRFLARKHRGSVSIQPSSRGTVVTVSLY